MIVMEGVVGVVGCGLLCLAHTMIKYIRLLQAGAPHHDCYIHAQLVASSPAGRIVESFPDPERDPLQAELFSNPPEIKNGWLTLNKEPGLGLTLSPSAMKKFGTLIYQSKK